MIGQFMRHLAPLAVAGALVLGGSIVARPGQAAYARGAGRVCVFLAPSGTFNLGHVGWAFLEGGTSNWIFGATENRSNLPFVKPGDNNYAWVLNGPWAGPRGSVLATFAGQLSIGGTFYHGAGYYTQVRCQNTSNSSVGAAVARANAIKGYGYGVVTDNCMDHAYNVLTTYGGNLVNPASNRAYWSPTVWFVALGVVSGFGPISTLASER